MKNRVDIIQEVSTVALANVMNAAADYKKFPISLPRRNQIKAENDRVNKKRTGSGGGGDVVAGGVGSGLYDSGKIEKPKEHKFMKDSYHPQNTTNNSRFTDIKESVNFVVSLFEGDKTREQRQQERLQHQISMERSRDELRQIRQDRKDRETEEANKKIMARYDGDNGKAALDRISKGSGVDPKIQDKIAALPAGGIERAKAIQKLVIANAYASAAETERTFHTTDLGRQAANEILRQQGKGPLPGKMPNVIPGAGLAGIAVGAAQRAAVDADLDVKAVLDARASEAKAGMDSARQADRDRARQNSVTGRRGMSPAEAEMAAAKLEKGWRNDRIGKIREFDPFIANNLDSMHRSVERERRTTAGFGEIHRDATVEADRIRDEMADNSVQRMRRDLQRDKDIQAARDAESVKAADEASAASEARINAYTAKGPSRWLETQKRPQIKVGEVAPNVNLPTTPGIELEDPNSWWNAPKVSTQAQVGGENRKPKGVGGFDELEPGEGPARVGQANNLVQSSVQQIARDAGRRRTGSAFA